MADAIIKGKSGKEYFFQSQGIHENCLPVDFFIYAKLYKDSRTRRKFWEHTTIDKANSKLCLQSEPDIDEDFIKQDLKEDETFTIQIEYIGT
jgi:hypothetical protein